MTITIPAWSIPAIVTAIAFCVAWFVTRDSRTYRGYADVLNGLFTLIAYLIAAVASLAAWALYGVLT